MGDNLLVGISSDEFALEKGQNPLWDWGERAMAIEALPYVDGIFTEHNSKQKEDDIKRFDANLLVMGSDWEGEYNNLNIEVIYLPRTPGISSTQLRKMINNGN